MNEPVTICRPVAAAVPVLETLTVTFSVLPIFSVEKSAPAAVTATAMAPVPLNAAEKERLPTPEL